MENIAQLGIKVDSSGIKQATNELSKLTNQSGKTEKSTNALTSGFLNLKNAVIGYASIQTAKQIIDTADSMNLLNARLKLATSSTAEYTSQQRALLNISKQSYTGISDTITLFTKLNPALQQVGTTTAQVNSVVASFTKGLQLGGSSAAEASSAILQFSQAMGSGVLRGEEFNAINEASPKLMSYLAKGLGVAQSELRKMAENGELTAGRVSNALLKVKSDIDRDFATLPVTVGKAMTNLKTELSIAIDEINNTTGATEALAKSIQTTTLNIGFFTKEILDYYREIKNFFEENKMLADAIGTSFEFLGKAGKSTLTIAALDTLNKKFGDTKLGADGIIKSIDELEKRKANLSQNKWAESNKKAIENQISDLKNQLSKINEKTIFTSSDVIPKNKTAIDNLVGDYEGAANTIDEINTKVVRNESELTKLIGNERAKFNLGLEDSIKKAREKGATESEINKFRADQLKEFNDKQNKSLDEQKKKLEETQKARAEIAQIGMSSYDKSISDITAKTIEWVKAGVSKNEVLQAEIKLRNELNSQTILENLQTELSYYEKKLQLQKDSLDKELDLKAIQYAQTVLNIENSDKTIEQKQKLIALEMELYDATVERLKADNNAEFQDTIKSFQEDSLARQIELNNAIFDFGAGFKSSNSEIMEVSKSLAAMSDASLKSKKAETELNKKYTTEFTKYAGDVEKTKELEKQYTIDTDLLNKQSINNQILGYANIAGAISGMFQQGSKDAATFQAAQTVLALVEGTRAILSAGTGDPYTAIPRMAAMAIMVKSLLGNIGVSLGIGGTNTTTSTSDSVSSQKANTGTGSVLGDASKASESITQSLAILKDYAKPEFRLTQQMVKSLQSIDNKMGGVSALLVQSGGFGFGAGFTPKASDTGWNGLGVSIQNASNKGISKVEDLLNSVLPIQTGGLATLGLKSISKSLDSVISGIFGKSSTTSSTKLTDSGIYFADQLLGSAIDEFYGSMYQTIQKKTTTTKKSWFGSSTSTSKKTSTYFEDMSGFTETERQFSLVLKSIYDSVGLAGEALGESSEKTDSQLNNFIVSIGKVSLKGLSGSQIQSTLTSIFGKIGDQLASSTFPVLVEFQAVGEGLFTTMTRVASGIEQADYYTDRLGKTFEKISYTDIMNKQGDVGFEALYQSIVKTDEALYGVDNNLIQIVKSLTGTAEELYDSYKGLDFLRSSIKFMGVNEQALGFESIKGAGGIEEFSNAINSYFENFLSESEQLAFKSQELAKEFDKLNITMPTTKQGFTDLIKELDVSTVSGQELYGRLILLNESFAEIIETADSKVENRSSLIDSLKDFVSSINSSLIKTTTFKDFSTSFNEMIEAIEIGSDDLTNIGSETIASAQSYLDTVARTAKSSAEIEFAKKIVANKFEGVINAEDITLGTINDTLKISFNEDSAIVKALNDVKNELVYLNQLNTRQTANSNKTLQLQRASIA